MTAPRKAFLTGGSGFLGSRVARDLLAAGWEVHAYVRDLAKGREALPAEADLIQGDLGDREALSKAAFQDFEAIFHVGALRSLWGVPEGRVHAVNVGSTRCLLEAAEWMGARFVYCSSALVEPVFRPTRYARSKLASEAAVAEAAARGVGAVVLRPSLLCGAGDPRGVVCGLSRALLGGKYVPVGAGLNRIVLTHVQDVSKAFVEAAQRPEARGGTFTLADVPGLPLQDCVAKVARQLRVQVGWPRIPRWAGLLAGWTAETACWLRESGSEPFADLHTVDVMTADHRFDAGPARERLGFRPAVPLEKGLAETVSYFLSLGKKKKTA